MCSGSISAVPRLATRSIRLSHLVSSSRYGFSRSNCDNVTSGTGFRSINVTGSSFSTSAVVRTTGSDGVASTTQSLKISTIVDQISTLTLLETAELVSTLKTRLNIPDLPVGGFASGPGVGTAAVVEEPEEVAPVQEKTLFNLKLEAFDPATKPKVIKEIKTLLGLSLVESKRFVESAPKMMKESVPKEEAEKIVEALSKVGGKVVME